MRKIVDLIGREARWIQPRALKFEYELRAGEALHATLRFPSAFKTTALAESAEGRWTFDRTGLWRPRATVQGQDGGRQLAELRYGFRRLGGILTLADGGTFSTRSNGWMTRYDIKTPDGAPVVSLRRIRVFLRFSAIVDVPAPATVLQDHPWLVAFGCYLTVLAQWDSAAAG